VPRTADPKTRENLLDAAQRLMLAKGYAATSVEEVCDAAGLTKGAFFHYFADKEALGRAAVSRFVERGAESFRDARFLREADPLRRTLGFVDHMIDLVGRGPEGCLVGVFSLELADTHPKIRAICARTFDTWAATLRAMLDEAKARCAPRTRIDTAALALHFFAVFEGAMLLRRAMGRPDLVTSSLALYRDHVERLFGGRPTRRS
jgi:TetR/AcrR family transcriptional repressor of nem operon